MAAKPEGEALNAGKQLDSTVQGETKKVQDNYGPIDNAARGGSTREGPGTSGAARSGSRPHR